ncbi:MAG: type I polyketide synthase [Desulfobacteraceae bacterium]|nr:type I polyketide synthase [Desulfobacteraceae bacterium]
MSNQVPIAVVGIGGIFPGALDTNHFWENLLNKKDTASEVIPGRWIVDPDIMVDAGGHIDRAYAKRCCLIPHPTPLPAGSRIPEKSLRDLDPLYRIIVKAGLDAWADCQTSAIDNARAGTILAAIALPTDASSTITREIFNIVTETKLFNDSDLTPYNSDLPESLSARVVGFPASLLSAALGVSGGAYTLDAACASSIYAVKLACDELRRFRADLMVTGGVSRPDCLYTQVGFSQLKALSRSGRCAPFDESADGLVVGEGAGILILKRLSDAIEHKDKIYGVIRGIGLSNDMRGNLLAPDTEGQLRAMRAAYQTAGWRPDDVDYIECHGAGTPVGDATELNSLQQLWDDSGCDRKNCAIGSVKSMTGHLLTAAGAAGMIKTLLALHHKILLPSLNFNRAPVNSPLHSGRFKVQTEPGRWEKVDSQDRRAAVSAFGFGGINAHILLEEYRPDRTESNSRPISVSEQAERKPSSSIAVVGMAAGFGSISTLRQYQQLIFNNDSIIAQRPENRWKLADECAEDMLAGRAKFGGYMDKLPIDIGEFQIPPNEIPQILPQQLLMLKVARDALKDSGKVTREYRPGMGAIIGIGFDFETTNFHYRWNLSNMVKSWNERYGLSLSGEQLHAWLRELEESATEPLNAPRVLGALGGIVASRVAREFRFGGPSFVVSADETSGLRALEIAVRSLQQDETDCMLVGAVDMCGDLRSVVCADQIHPYSERNLIRPFDSKADGTLPGEGAAALILKRETDAVDAGDRIYAVIKGMGAAHTGDLGTLPDKPSTYVRSLSKCVADAQVTTPNISYIETHGSGIPAEDALEAAALQQYFGSGDNLNSSPCAIGTVKPNIGHTGASAGLASVVKTCLCLHQEMLPGLKNYASHKKTIWTDHLFHIPVSSQYWMRDRSSGPRQACVGAMTSDGNCAHVLLQESSLADTGTIPHIHSSEKRRPAGAQECGLFICEGEDKNQLLDGLKELRHFLSLSDTRAQAGLENPARNWYRQHPLNPDKKQAIAICLRNPGDIGHRMDLAESMVISGPQNAPSTNGGIYYSPNSIGAAQKLALVFPGSGNHYVGMGRGIGIQWPEVMREMDASCENFLSQSLPQYFMPWRTSWEKGWEAESLERIESDPLHMIFGQVIYGSLMWNLFKRFSIKPDAVIGYSLGETAGLFATGAWRNRQEMLDRMRRTDLFSAELSGPCLAARKAWNIPKDADFQWQVAAIDQSADAVKPVIAEHRLARLLIVNTPDECVIGGETSHVRSVIKQLGCHAVPLQGVVTVHCDALLPVAGAYKDLHLLTTTPPENLTYYTCAQAKSYAVTSESAAAAILRQATDGFDFNRTIEQAYADGIRIFLEMGPRASCTRMIGCILGDRPHLAVSASMRGEDDYLTVIKCLGALVAERVPVDLDMLYGDKAYPPHFFTEPPEKTDRTMVIHIGGKPLSPAPPPIAGKSDPVPDKIQASVQTAGHPLSETPFPFNDKHSDKAGFPFHSIMDSMNQGIQNTTELHEQFLSFSDDVSRNFGDTFDFQNRLLSLKMQDGGPQPTSAVTDDLISVDGDIAFDRNQCMEFAIGKAGKVLGPEFDIVDTYKVRVRLPDEPLMLVDRIVRVTGDRLSLSAGQIITEHDVLADAWYLDGNRAPVCISVEAGQADLFLSSYLGIDHKVKGERAYRLLDAVVTFHRGLPQPGDTIRYTINIDKFIRQQDTYLFFFRFEGYIGDSHLISMKDGCAGFFTENEVRESGGIILTPEEKTPAKGQRPADWMDLVSMKSESFTDRQLQALRTGKLSDCFGAQFTGIHLPESLRLPGGRMELIDRILSLDPTGGRFGLGSITAEADIHGDEWFLACHFVDDMVMPGTLMYECCAHTLRVFLQRLGWVTEKTGVRYEPVVGNPARLKCRGPVTPDTQHVHYEIHIKEIGFNPEPYVIADAHMYADGHHIVFFDGMSMKMSGITRPEIERYWQNRRDGNAFSSSDSSPNVPQLARPEAGTRSFSYDKILALSVGNPSDCFGEPYRQFDHQRRVARLPGPPYCFVDRITHIDPEPWQLKPGGWLRAEHDVMANHWYFSADKSGILPYCILLEIALQPCGFLAAYAGSALRSEKDLKFRNLGGSGIIHSNVHRSDTRLHMYARMTKVSETADMIIENFDFRVFAGDQPIYTGDTYFGFFTDASLGEQKGLGVSDQVTFYPSRRELSDGVSYTFPDIGPLTPETADDHSLKSPYMLQPPAKAIRMIDRIEDYLPDGGPEGLGYARAIKKVDPEEWFFTAHFHQDPVCPGSLGVESLIQIFRYMAGQKWAHMADTHRVELITDMQHNWIYRGQILRSNAEIEVMAAVTHCAESPIPTLFGDGWLKVDGLFIYKMENFGVRLVPNA